MLLLIAIAVSIFTLLFNFYYIKNNLLSSLYSAISCFLFTAFVYALSQNYLETHLLRVAMLLVFSLVFAALAGHAARLVNE